MKSKLISRTLRLFPKEMRQRLKVHCGAPHVRWSLMQLRSFGFAPKQVMDVGASLGHWTRVCLEIFPEAHITCVEPLPSLQKGLQKVAAEYQNVQVIQTLLGSQEKEEVPFEEREEGGSHVVRKGAAGRRIRMTTIDRLLERGFCEPPEFLKLDVQGYEMEVLDGYTRQFDHCQVIQCEISLLPIVEEAPLLHEVTAYPHRRGFVMFDVDQLITSPFDGAMWQIDALFCRIDSPLRRNRVWGKAG